MDKLFILSFDKTGDNYEGKSLLRKVYRPWQTKDRYLRYENRLQEKFCGGVIQAWLPRNATDDDKSAYETVIEDFLATKRNGVLHP